MFNRRFLFIFSLLTLSLNAYSQTLLKGRIVDQKGSLPYVGIMLTDQQDTTLVKRLTSDSIGNFELKNITKGKYSLSFSLIGYQKNTRNVSVDNNSLQTITLGDVVLTEDLNLLSEVTISGGTPNFRTQNGQLKIGVANNTFFKSASNLLDVFKKLPGLQVNQDGTMQLASRATPTLFVDGRPANMKSDEIQIYLSSLSPDMVESIEMITHPSSKYDGEYQGIIDVQLKRHQSLGLRGTYNGRFQRNNYSLLDNNLSLVYKANRFIYDLKLGYTTGSTFYKYHALQYLPDANAMTTDTRTATANQNYNVQAKISYQLRKGQIMEAFIRNFQIDRNATSRNLLITQTPDLSNTVGLIKSNNDAFPKQHNYAGGLNYDAVFKNSELHLIAAVAQVDNRQTEDIQNRNDLTDTLLNYWKTRSRNNILIRVAQADYVQNMGLGKLEFGGKFAYSSTQNDLRYDTLGNAVFSLDSRRSNQFRYQEYIAAGYLSYIGNWNKFNYRLSLRAEHTDTEANSITTNTITERSYLKWLPSLSVTYAINKDEQLTFSYSRRLTRPTFSALNPFRFYYSPRHYWIGNPYLQPSTTNLLALSFSKKALNITLNAGRETDPMERYPEYNPETNELIFLGRNIPYRDFANILMSLPITVNKWWRMNNNAGLYYNRELRPYFGNIYQIPIYNYTLNGSQVFSLKNWLLDISYTYESKSGNGLYIMKPVYGIDFGLQKTWLKNKINTKLTLYDAFDNIKRRLIFRDKTMFNNDFYHYFASQRLVFSLTYNFGSSTYKARESKKSDEENRAN
ncbi:outer membrane beta-barrel protein [Pedobacter insulae]|uniref:TonB-dependent Receptor Plug Domain n=1 Tax=Pedobacter insulae TaxID=414048 RepID=A0A1I2YQX1_9SPHI|nr:outer membrane beta-barrel protein [Pedobacter insulae]SFH28054.1 TonB-dependent Receptor Plug Domain [Pedobacter insulae]